MVARHKSRARDVPLYVELYADLRAKLQTGEFSPGDLFPAESVLMERYGVSRITVRAALDHLVNDGFLDRYPGRGSYVKALEPQPRSCLVSFTQQMLSQGRKPVTQLLKLEQLRSGQAETVMMPFDASESLILIERLRRVDGEVVALVKSYLPKRLVPGISREHFLETGQGQSILYVLERRFSIILDKGEETLIPACLKQPESELLGVATGSSVILKVCLVRDIRGRPVLYEEAFWCAPQTQLVHRRVAST